MTIGGNPPTPCCRIEASSLKTLHMGLGFGQRLQRTRAPTPREVTWPGTGTKLLPPLAVLARLDKQQGEGPAGVAWR